MVNIVFNLVQVGNSMNYRESCVHFNCVEEDIIVLLPVYSY